MDAKHTEVDTHPSFEFRAPKILFQGHYTSYFVYETHPWDIHPDGKRFLMMKRAALTEDGSAEGGPSQINIVLNWFEELKERVPVQ